MARNKGSANLAASLEVLAGAPLDAREVVQAKADLTAEGSFPYKYVGMEVYVVAEDKKYRFIGVDPTDIADWEEVTGGGGGSYTAGDGIDITEDVISTKKSQEGDIDEIIDVYPQAGDLVSIVNAFNKGDIYSTEERMIGQWHDGKPIYQKTFTGTSTAGASYYIDISSLNVDTPIDLKGYCKATNDNYIFGGNWRSQASDSLLYYVSSDKTKLYLDSGTTNVHGDYVLTLQYTKTTDTAISIGSTTEYSTDEKVVGTWLDGKPIFQKTIQGTMPTVTTNGTPVDGYISLGVNIDYFVEVRGMMDLNNGAYRPLDSVHKGTSTMFYNAVAGVTNSSDSNKNSIRITNNNTTWNGMTIYVTAQYTKTTT